MPGILIAGTHSGCGKTTVTLGIMAALRKKGLDVQPFKAGPDFIDAGLHRLAAGRTSRNLDVWMCGEEYVLDCYRRHNANADIAVIEGVMGMYDGDFSSAHIAQLLNVPVLLVVDAYGMAESAGAVVKGFLEFGIRNSECEMKKQDAKSEIRNPKSAISLAGVVFNRVASESHYKRLKESVQDVPVLGCLPREIDFEIPHRHLGLTVAEEDPLAEENIGKLADSVLHFIDIDAIREKAGATKKQHDRAGNNSAFRISNSAFRVAVAYDKAFCFYYQDNLDALMQQGAELVHFSPLGDSCLPKDVDALYIGGGYPELHAETLSRNSSMLSSVRAWAEAGRPLYAECGGLMYLSQGIMDFENQFFGMAGVLPFKTKMTKKPRLAYREIVLNEDCILGTKEQKLRGHEFHYSDILTDTATPVERIYSVRDKKGAGGTTEGFKVKNTLASYIHVHFGSNKNIAPTIAECVRSHKLSFPKI